MGLKPPFSWPHMLKKNWVINQIRHSKIGHFDTPPRRHAFVMVPPPRPPSEKLKQNIFHLFYRTQIDLQNYLTILNVFKNWGISWNAPFSISIGHWLRFAFYQSNICQVHKLSTINCTILLKIKVFTRELSFGDFNISIGLAGLGSQLTDFLTPTP